MDNTFKKLLYRAPTRLPSSMPIAARVLSNVSLQRVLKDLGAGKPTFILYGKPGNGKTSLVRATLGKNKLGKIKEIKFADGLKEIKKAIKDMKGIERGDDDEVPIIFLDNYQKALSDYKQEMGRRILDYTIDIVSEDEQAPLVIITGEPDIINDVEKVESLIGRTLIIKMHKIDDDEELCNIRECFSENHQTEYSNMWDAYDRWTKNNPVDEAEVSCELKKYRQKYFRKYEYRQIGLVFCYYYAIGRFSRFLEAEYGEGISMRDVENNVQELFEWKEASGNDRSSFEIDVWNEFVQDDGIKKVFTPRLNTCKLLAECDCDNYNRYECYRCEGDPVERYDPMDLRLPEDLTAAILIEKSKMIPNFPRHIVCDSPLLMIRSASLLEMLNIYLEAYSRKKRISVRSLTQKKFNKELFAHNLCLFEYVGIRHNVFTFRMKDVRNENVRVIFIKLTTEQYEKLKKAVERNDKKFKIRNYKEEDVKEMHDCLNYFCVNVQSLIGEVGAPSKVLNAEN